ncbi:MAG: hypothetical protein EOP50_00330 [Sphingobacteriales bacterium]|nr:MAG: hypothetical protein EOP50_00330 [Sphingobacteriales bacterium]
MRLFQERVAPLAILCLPALLPILPGCQLQNESDPPNVSGTYVLQVKTRYGSTSDTIEVEGKKGTALTK